MNFDAAIMSIWMGRIASVVCGVACILSYGMAFYSWHSGYNRKQLPTYIVIGSLSLMLVVISYSAWQKPLP